MGRGPAGQNVAGNAPTPRDRASGPQGPMGGTGEAPAGRWDLPGRREQGAPNQVNLEEGAGSRKSHRSWQRAGGEGTERDTENLLSLPNPLLCSQAATPLLCLSALGGLGPSWAQQNQPRRVGSATYCD